MAFEDWRGSRLADDADFKRGLKVFQRLKARSHKHSVAYGSQAYEQDLLYTIPFQRFGRG